jgi:hypothetical protein
LGGADDARDNVTANALTSSEASNGPRVRVGSGRDGHHRHSVGGVDRDVGTRLSVSAAHVMGSPLHEAHHAQRAHEF